MLLNPLFDLAIQGDQRYDFEVENQFDVNYMPSSHEHPVPHKSNQVKHEHLPQVTLISRLVLILIVFGPCATVVSGNTPSYEAHVYQIQHQNKDIGNEDLVLFQRVVEDVIDDEYYYGNLYEVVEDSQHQDEVPNQQ